MKVLVMDLQVKEYEFSVSKIEVFDEWQKHPKENRNSRLYDFLSMKNDLASITEASARDIKMKIGRLPPKFAEKYEKRGYCRDRFLIKNCEWLSGDFTFKVSIDHSAPSTSKALIPGPGRPSVDFTEASEKTKRRRVDDLVQTRDVNQLVVAAEISARLSGHEQRCLTKEEALAYYVDAKATSHSYKKTRKWSIKAGHQVFPSFYSVRQTKIDCYPREEQILITETRAETKLQILDKTAERLICAQHEFLKFVAPGSSLSLISKWRCDGSLEVYSVEDSSEEEFSDVE